MPKFKVGDIISKPDVYNPGSIRIRKVLSVDTPAVAMEFRYWLERIYPDPEGDNFGFNVVRCDRQYSLHDPIKAFVNRKLESLGYATI